MLVFVIADIGHLSCSLQQCPAMPPKVFENVEGVKQLSVIMDNKGWNVDTY
jgi:hypothetical protein